MRIQSVMNYSPYIHSRPESSVHVHHCAVVMIMGKLRQQIQTQFEGQIDAAEFFGCNVAATAEQA